MVAAALQFYAEEYKTILFTVVILVQVWDYRMLGRYATILLSQVGLSDVPKDAASSV
jgi:hypothetical protein